MTNNVQLTEKQIRSFKTRARHERLRALGLCINGPEHAGPSKSGKQHGPVVRGGKCADCIAVHRSSW